MRNSAPGDCSIFLTKHLVVIFKHKNDSNNNDREDLNITMEIFTKNTTEEDKKASLHLFLENAN